MPEHNYISYLKMLSASGSPQGWSPFSPFFFFFEYGFQFIVVLSCILHIVIKTMDSACSFEITFIEPRFSIIFPVVGSSLKFCSALFACLFGFQS